MASVVGSNHAYIAAAFVSLSCMSLALVYLSLRPVVLCTLSVDRLRYIYGSFSADHLMYALQPATAAEPAVLRPADLCRREELLSVKDSEAILRVCVEGAAAALAASRAPVADETREGRLPLGRTGERRLAPVRFGGLFDDIFRRAGYNVKVRTCDIPCKLC